MKIFVRRKRFRALYIISQYCKLQTFFLLTRGPSRFIDSFWLRWLSANFWGPTGWFFSWNEKRSISLFFVFFLISWHETWTWCEFLPLTWIVPCNWCMSWCDHLLHISVSSRLLWRNLWLVHLGRGECDVMWRKIQTRDETVQAAAFLPMIWFKFGVYPVLCSCTWYGLESGTPFFSFRDLNVYFLPLFALNSNGL